MAFLNIQQLMLERVYLEQSQPHSPTEKTDPSNQDTFSTAKQAISEGVTDLFSKLKPNTTHGLYKLINKKTSTTQTCIEISQSSIKLYKRNTFQKHVYTYELNTAEMSYNKKPATFSDHIEFKKRIDAYSHGLSTKEVEFTQKNKLRESNTCKQTP